MLCNSVRAVFVGVLFTASVGWLEVFLQATETCPNSEKKSPVVRARGMLRISKAGLPVGLVPPLTTMTKLFAGWPAILTKLSASFPAPLCRTSNLFWGQPRSNILRCPRIVVLFDVFSLTAMNGSVFLLGSCQVLVMQ